MEKYMGNKSKLCETIYTEIIKFNRGGKINSFFDPFAGTTNVSRYFKKKKVNIVCNDINDFSYILGQTYVKNNSVPEFLDLYSKNEYFKRNIEEIITTKVFNDKIKLLLEDNKKTINNICDFKKNAKFCEVFTYLTYFASKKDYDESHSFDIITNYYCENGTNSRYINLVYKKSLDNILKNTNNSKVKKTIEKFYRYPYDIKYLRKGLNGINEKEDTITFLKLENIINKKNLVGVRKFFSIEHGLRIDIIYNTICYWKDAGYISESEYYVLLTSILETVTLFSNTSATYQAFYKDYRSNTQQRFRLVIPEIDKTKIKADIYKLDAKIIIPEITADVMYLDPPYNWRQYDSNYHLLNTIARFNDLEDKNKFKSEIIGASGENRAQKSHYTSFNIKTTFEANLLNLINSSKCEIVALSYSDSKSNHKRGDIVITIDRLKSFFGNKKAFSAYKIIEIKSTKFESRKGNKKEPINELLFLARKIV